MAQAQQSTKPCSRPDKGDALKRVIAEALGLAPSDVRDIPGSGVKFAAQALARN